MMIKKTIVWNIISRCNLDCEYCFGPSYALRASEGKPLELSTEQALQKLHNFRKQGFELIVFTGGEPLLRKDIVTLVREAKKLGFFTILHTNGILLREDLFDKFKGDLDQINLPLDGLKEEKYVERVRECLTWLKNKKVRVVISTVVTDLNKDKIIEIGQNLPSFIYKWRIFEYKTGKNPDKYRIKCDEFDKITKQIKQSNVQIVHNDDKKFYSSFVVSN